MHYCQRRTENRLDWCKKLLFQPPLHLERICRKDHRLKSDEILTTGGTRELVTFCYCSCGPSFNTCPSVIVFISGTLDNRDFWDPLLGLSLD